VSGYTSSWPNIIVSEVGNGDLWIRVIVDCRFVLDLRLSIADYFMKALFGSNQGITDQQSSTIQQSTIVKSSITCA